MRLILALLFMTGVLTSAVSAQSINITGPSRSAMLEGQSYPISWTSSGIESVSIVIHGTRTPLGTRSRGDFSFDIANSVPAGRGGVEWKVPWIDSMNFFVKAKGYDSSGHLVAQTERGYGFRPRVLANRMEDGIYLDLHKRTDQRLYVQRNYRITHAYLSSSSRNYLWMSRNRHISNAHDHAGVSSVLEKKPMHWSTLFNVEMPWAIRYHGGHFIHATSPNLYHNLGGPASSGCNRLTRHDARELYRMTPLGTRVEVIGPNG